MPVRNNKIFIVAGEASGDMHAASLIREINVLNENITFCGIGGNEMKKMNAELLYGIEDVNFIGFSSVIMNIKKIKAVLKQCELRIKEDNPDAVILVDYPGFNLKLISNIRKFYKGKIIYYISPQLWAWHKSRIKIIRKNVDLLIVVFPFEVDFYEKEGIKAEFAGHPLVKRIDGFLNSNLKEKNDKIQISMLPGSRKDEIERMLPVLMETAVKFQNEFECNVNFICSSNFSRAYFTKAITGSNFNIIYDENNTQLNYRTILNSDLVITKSGTSTLECALIGTPFCVIYKTGKLNYAIGSRIVKIKNIAMVNILSGREIVREFLQDDANPENMFKEGKKILTNIKYRDEMKNNFRHLREILTKEDASENAARLIVQNLEGN